MTTSNLLLALGVRRNLKGFEILKESIDMMLRTGAKKAYMGAVIYPELMRIFDGSTYHTLERAMRDAVSQPFDTGDLDMIQAVFGSSIDPNKGHATITQFLAACAGYLREVHDEPTAS